LRPAGLQELFLLNLDDSVRPLPQPSKDKNLTILDKRPLIFDPSLSALISVLD
jgi:hypothetical protein